MCDLRDEIDTIMDDIEAEQEAPEEEPQSFEFWFLDEEGEYAFLEDVAQCETFREMITWASIFADACVDPEFGVMRLPREVGG